MNNEVMKADDHEPDYRKAMLYHSDRADAYMAERDAALSEVSRLRDRLARMEGALQRAVDGYGQKMRNATDKREKRDWQSMLIAAVDIQSVALTDGGSNG